MDGWKLRFRVLTHGIAGVIVLCLGFGTGFGGTVQPPVSNDPLEGIWELTSVEVEGETNQGSEMLLTCQKGSYTLKIGDRQIEAGKYKIDAQANPKTIDLEITDGDDRGKKQLGIWKKEGDQLTVCFAFPAAEVRPKEFTGAKGSKQILVRLKKRPAQAR
jgi:uncharacterized protein (TIGR03067 family)